MFTTGSKVFFGSALLALVGVFAYATTSGGTGDLNGFWLLLAFAGVLTFLGGVMIAFRDADPSPEQLAVIMSAETGTTITAPRVSNSAWPAVAALGLMTTCFGLVLDRRVFVFGIVIMLAAGLEWTVQAWADRASDDPAYNAAIRAKMARPVEVPLFGAIIGVFVVIGFSRILLAASEVGSVVVFGAVAGVVFLMAVLFGYVPKLGRSLVAAVLVLGAAGVLAVGIVGINQGERTFEVKSGEEKDSNSFISDKSSNAGTVTVAGNKLTIAATDGVLVVPKGTITNILFRNSDSSRHALVIENGKGEKLFQTDLIEQNKVAVLTFRLPTAGEYKLVTEGGSVAAESVIKVL